MPTNAIAPDPFPDSNMPQKKSQDSKDGKETEGASEPTLAMLNFSRAH
jgi:hypothetical protein